MSHHPANLTEPRQKCNGRSCYPNKHVADKAAKMKSVGGATTFTTFKCKQCGTWHIKADHDR